MGRTKHEELKKALNLKLPTSTKDAIKLLYAPGISSDTAVLIKLIHDELDRRGLPLPKKKSQ